MTTLAIIFSLLLLDAIVANIIAFFGEQWYIRHFRLISRYFHMDKGWTLYYLALVLYIGYLTFS